MALKFGLRMNIHGILGNMFVNCWHFNLGLPMSKFERDSNRLNRIDSSRSIFRLNADLDRVGKKFANRIRIPYTKSVNSNTPFYFIILLSKHIEICISYFFIRILNPRTLGIKFSEIRSVTPVYLHLFRFDHSEASADAFETFRSCRLRERHLNM